MGVLRYNASFTSTTCKLAGSRAALRVFAEPGNGLVVLDRAMQIFRSQPLFALVKVAKASSQKLPSQHSNRQHQYSYGCGTQEQDKEKAAYKRPFHIA